MPISNLNHPVTIKQHSYFVYCLKKVEKKRKLAARCPLLMPVGIPDVISPKLLKNKYLNNDQSSSDFLWHKNKIFCMIFVFVLKKVVRLLTMNVWISNAPPPHDITPYHLVSMSTFYTTLGEGRYHIGIIFSGFMVAFETSNCSIIQTHSSLQGFLGCKIIRMIVVLSPAS